MFLIARLDQETGWESDWLVDLAPASERVHVTTRRENARRFKRESDAASVRDMAASIAPESRWRVVPA